MASTETSEPQVGAEFDEARCIETLRYLEELQEKVDELRLAIPRIFEPLQKDHQPSPAHLVTEFKKAGDAASKELNTFKLAWRDAETRNIIKKTTELYKKDRDLSAASRVPKYGWSVHSQLPDPTAKVKEARADTDARNAAEPNENVDIAQVVEDYKAAHANFKVVLESDNQIIKIQFKVPSLLLQFVITIQKTPDGKQKLEVECIGDTRLHGAITRSIASRPRPNDIHYLLDMIAAYGNVRMTACSRCGKLVDDAGLTPAARRLKDGEVNAEKPSAEWLALHERCLI